MPLSPLESVRAARDEAWEGTVAALADLRPHVQREGIPALASLDGYLHELLLLHKREAALLAPCALPPAPCPETTPP